MSNTPPIASHEICRSRKDKMQTNKESTTRQYFIYINYRIKSYKRLRIKYMCDRAMRDLLVFIKRQKVYCPTEWRQRILARSVGANKYDCVGQDAALHSSIESAHERAHLLVRLEWRVIRFCARFSVRIVSC